MVILSDISPINTSCRYMECHSVHVSDAGNLYLDLSLDALVNAIAGEEHVRRRKYGEKMHHFMANATAPKSLLLTVWLNPARSVELLPRILQ